MIEGPPTEVEVLRAALRPFAEQARRFNVNPKGDDLWVSLAVAGSAWVRARELLADDLVKALL